MKNRIPFKGVGQYLKLVIPILMFPAYVSCSKGKPDTCPDPYSLNYSEGRGSIEHCRYDVVDRLPTFITNLDQQISETSGIARIGDRLVTHNDKGGKNELFAFGLDGKVTNTFTIEGAEHVDWEDLAESEEHIYILDAGNNDGDRRDLRIYKVKKSDFDFSTATSIVPVDEVIRFEYPEQTNFQKQNKHNFDCEALIHRDGYLYLFTKHRLDGQTVLYKLPAEEGNYPAERISSFQAGVQITGADIRADGLEVYLIGYNKKQECVLWKLSEYNSDDFLSGRKEQIKLGPFAAMGQMEAVLYQPEMQKLYITSERVEDLPPRLYEISID